MTYAAYILERFLSKVAAESATFESLLFRKLRSKVAFRSKVSCVYGVISKVSCFRKRISQNRKKSSIFENMPYTHESLFSKTTSESNFGKRLSRVYWPYFTSLIPKLCLRIFIKGIACPTSASGNQN